MRVWAMGGDASAAPSHSEPALAAALAAGVSGLALQVYETRDQVLVCVPREVGANQLAFADVSALDAGATFEVHEAGYDPADRSRNLPWSATPSREALRYRALSDVLRMFGRKTRLLFFADANVDVAQRIAALIQEFGVIASASIVIPPAMLESVRRSHPDVVLSLAFSAATEQLSVPALFSEESRNLHALLIRADVMGGREKLSWITLAKQLGVEVLVDFCGAKARFDSEWPREYGSIVAGLVTELPLAAMSCVEPPSLVVHALREANASRRLLATGYSHANAETRLELKDNAFSIIVSAGSVYSGGAAVLRDAIIGRFDARVDFRVESPAQGTTFEMAAIAIDPGASRSNNQSLTTETVSLLFDVHGAPPYASAERDEDDGFRIGWNNCSNLTRVLEDWSASSVNMYNRYGRDVGSGLAAHQSGSLRLMRSGSLFAAYYADTSRQRWICCGAATVATLPDAVFLRLAAKHWPKGGGPAPANCVTFSNFTVRQYAPATCLNL